MEAILSKEKFYEVIGGDQLTVVKFVTTWCPDCKKLNLFIDDVIAEHNDKAWYEMNSEEFPEISDKYEVMGVPSLLVYRNGEKIAHLHSKYTKTKEQVLEFLQNLSSETTKA